MLVCKTAAETLNYTELVTTNKGRFCLKIEIFVLIVGFKTILLQVTSFSFMYLLILKCKLNLCVFALN